MGLVLPGAAQSLPNPAASADATRDPDKATAPASQSLPAPVGAGDLMILPPRVILEGRQRGTEVMLRNAGKARCTYRIYWEEMRMLLDGKVEEAKKAEGSITASDLVRYTPKQVELGPGETQVVRLMVRLPEGLKDGEYRSHLVFQGLPPAQPPAPVDQGPEKKNLSFNIQTILAFGIPVFVRHGETHAQIGMSHLALKPAAAPGQAPTLELQLDRQGNRSVQGELQVDWKPASGRSLTLASGRETVIYPEVDACAERVILDGVKDLQLAHGKLKVTFAYKDSKQPPEVAFLDVP
jgi:P pilus assembly chaperone PapD